MECMEICIIIHKITVMGCIIHYKHTHQVREYSSLINTEIAIKPINNVSPFMNYYMSQTPPVYMQPPIYDYSMHNPASSQYHRKNSESAALMGGGIQMQKHNSAMKASSFPKKQNGRKRILSTSEAYYSLKTRTLSNTKDSSTSSNAKYSSPNNKQMNGGQSPEPKNTYLMKLRQCIKEKGEDSIRIRDLKDHIAEISQDQIGSRFIQKVYEESTLEEK